MRLLANENMPLLAVRVLREAGHDVSWIAEDCPSTQDADVLARAVAQGRVLVTRDKDFGELAYRARLPATCGVVLLRVGPDPRAVASLIRQVLSTPVDFVGHFTVVEPGRVRVRPLPL